MELRQIMGFKQGSRVRTANSDLNQKDANVGTQVTAMVIRHLHFASY